MPLSEPFRHSKVAACFLAGTALIDLDAFNSLTRALWQLFSEQLNELPTAVIEALPLEELAGRLSL
jgi:hypothetical protein